MAPSGTPPSTWRDGRRVDVQDRGRPVGEEVVRERGERVRPGRAADDHQAPAAGDPAPQAGELGGGEGAGVHVLPHQPVERRPRLEPVGQVFGGERRDRRRGALRVRQEVDLPTSLAGFSDTTPTTSWDWSWRAIATGASAMTFSPSTSWTLTLPPKRAAARTGCRSCASLSRARPGSRTGSWSPRRPPTRSSPVIVGPAFSRSTAIANQHPAGRGPGGAPGPSSSGRRRRTTMAGAASPSRTRPQIASATTARAGRERLGQGHAGSYSTVGRRSDR